MAFKTAAQLFGNGAGAPLSPGWVPIDTNPPPAFTPDNRGIAFGEQLSSAIANRPHYALALNDEDLNSRLATFETGGLDAAYDNGSLGPAGGGRTVIKDAGAIETTSAMPATYADDIANAHIRLNSFGNTSRGGGGLDVAGWARGATSTLYGVLDRRGVNFSGTTSLGDTVAVLLSAPNTVTITGAEVFSTAGATHLNPGYDFIEILSGPDAGVYVLGAISSPAACTILGLDGSVPSLTAGPASIRVCRAIFGSFARFGHNGALAVAGPTFAGPAGVESAADFIGSRNGRYDVTSLDAPKNALRVLRPTGFGILEPKLLVDGQGQVRSLVSSTQQTAAQAAAAQDFGVAAFVAEHGGVLPAYEAGFVAKRGGATAAWFGVAAMDSARPPTTPTGSFAFNFINILGLNVQLTDTVAVDWNVNPTATLVEITSPSANAGIYFVNARGPSGTGRLTLTTLAGGVPAFPLAGLGSLRILYGTSLGNREYDVGISTLVGWTAQGRATALLTSPKEVGGAALVLESGNQSGSPADYFLLRGMSADTGATTEVFAVTSRGDLKASTVEAGISVLGGTVTATTNVAAGADVIAVGDFLYPVPVARTMKLSPYKFSGDTFTTDIGDPQIAWRTLTGSGIQSQKNLATLWCDLAGILRSGCAITSIAVTVIPGAARAPGSRMQLAIQRSVNTSAVAATLGTAEDNGSALEHTFTLTPGVPIPLDFSLYSYFLVVQAGNDGGPHNLDFFFGITVSYTDPGPRNF